MIPRNIAGIFVRQYRSNLRAPPTVSLFWFCVQRRGFIILWVSPRKRILEKAGLGSQNGTCGLHFQGLYFLWALKSCGWESKLLRNVENYLTIAQTYPRSLTPQSYKIGKTVMLQDTLGALWPHLTKHNGLHTTELSYIVLQEKGQETGAKDYQPFREFLWS
jgi:hypothetical protein